MRGCVRCPSRDKHAARTVAHAPPRSVATGRAAAQSRARARVQRRCEQSAQDVSVAGTSWSAALLAAGQAVCRSCCAFSPMSSSVSSVTGAVPAVSAPAKPHHPPAVSTTRAMIIAVVMGTLFGFAMNRGNVYLPEVVADQMLMRRMMMMKMFLAAAGTSMLIVEMLRWFKATRPMFERARDVFASVHRNTHAALVGGFMLGIGMYLGGTCPGTAYIQIGAGLWTAPFIFLGGILGGMAFTVLHDQLMPWINCNKPTHSSLEHHPDVNVTAVRLASVAGIVVLIAALEWLYPWHVEARMTADELALPLWRMRAWPPALAGVLVGVLQLIGIVGAGKTLGSSQSYMMVMAHTILHRWDEHKYLKTFRGNVMHWWQTAYVFAAIAGSALAMYLSGSSLPTSTHGMLVSVLSGFLLLLGSRIAGGCTSGHGLSGVGLLATTSLTAVPMMFAGGMLAALVDRLVNGL